MEKKFQCLACYLFQREKKDTMIYGHAKLKIGWKKKYKKLWEEKNKSTS